MGAFWHLFLPVTVHITMNKDEFEAVSENRIALPEPFAKNFFEVNRDEWFDENRFSGTRHKINLTYMLKDKIKTKLSNRYAMAEYTCVLGF